MIVTIENKILKIKESVNFEVVENGEYAKISYEDYWKVGEKIKEHDTKTETYSIVVYVDGVQAYQDYEPKEKVFYVEID